MSPAAPSQRKVTRVAVGVLVRSDGHVLLADRPAGKPYAGYWEFPGGKIEPGEDVAAALERELDEELGIEIGRSVPWVTFEFDYPHAYVELQFRVVHEWRGDPHSREGQRVGFFDPAGALPQPLLPAALPTLRWLLFPRTVLVVDPQGSQALPAGAENAGRIVWSGAAPIVVVDADWRGAGAETTFALLRTQLAIRQSPLLASGPGAERLTDADGVVLEAGAIARTVLKASRLRGAWVGCAEELRVASQGGCDFVLVRSAVLAEQLRQHSASVPAYFPCNPGPIAAAQSADWNGQGRWIDLRAPPVRGN
jgi:8-oxo-dGTP diphosphatase